MRIGILGMALALAACSDPTISGGSTGVGALPDGATQAFFASRPANLFFAAGAVCDGPGQTVVRPNANEVRCESLPDPESAAALILQFNGTVENLPKFVIAFTGQDNASGYVVTADTYIRVPQRSGGAQLVRFPDDRITGELSEILQNAGGRPL